MGKILVVVESPNKTAKILSFLGSGYKVEASYGIFRDLDKKKMSIDFDNKFEPQYVTTKPDVVKRLKNSMKGIDMLYIASDLDYEGENIAQSIYDILQPKQYKRLIFNAITKEAILSAIKTAGKINSKKVDAQKTRRVIDRLYGYLISPILQQKLGKGLSAGRVQSVASRIVIDRENEISNFIEKNKDSSSYKTTGIFSNMKALLYKLSDKVNLNTVGKNKLIGTSYNIELHENAEKVDINVKNFLNKCILSDFTIHYIDKRESTRSPSPPFTTSTLQQEANRKFGMALETTMSVAQKLYEAGYITYMRTDSVEISPDGHTDIKNVIIKKYGDNYYKKNEYKNKSSSSQEAHEAIRPVHAELDTIKNKIDDEFQIKLYSLIWQRTIASQMANAKLDITLVQISISEYMVDSLQKSAKKTPVYFFTATSEKITFKGFMKVYVESSDSDVELNNESSKQQLKIGQKLIMTNIICRQEYLRAPSRYTPASLVKKLEELGIGRPSTYVNTLKVIIDRNYVVIGDSVGITKQSSEYTIKKPTSKNSIQIEQTINQVNIGADTKKLIPTNVGINVNTFLMNYFSEIMSYNFTASVEHDMDEVANGNMIWFDVVGNFYNKLKPMIEQAKISSTSKILGFDKNNNEISVTIAKYGPVVKKKLSTANSKQVKYIYAKIKEPYTIETITLKQALELLLYPKLIGSYKDNDVLLQKGDKNYYIIYDHNNYPIESTDIDIENAIKLIKLKEKKSLGKFDLIDGKIKILAVLLDGPYGPYIQITKNNKKENFKIPKNLDIKKITSSQILEIIKTKKKPFSKKSKTNN